MTCKMLMVVLASSDAMVPDWNTEPEWLDILASRLLSIVQDKRQTPETRNMHSPSVPWCIPCDQELLVICSYPAAVS